MHADKLAARLPSTLKGEYSSLDDHPSPKDGLMPKKRKIIEEQTPTKRHCTRAARKQADKAPRQQQASTKRKRDLIDEEQEANDPDSRPQKLRLTRQNLHLLHKQLEDVEPKMESSFSTNASQTTELSTASRDTEISKKNVTSRDPNFHYEVTRRGCELVDFGEDKPDDGSEVLEYLHKARQSLLTDLDPTKFRENAAYCTGEQNVVANVTKNLVVDLDKINSDSKRFVTENVSWSAPNYNVLGPFVSDNGLAVPKADLTFGHTTRAFEQWAGAIDKVESSIPNIAAGRKGVAKFPYFTAEAKSENGSLRVAHSQSLHNVLTIACNYITLGTLAGTVDNLLGKVFAMTVEHDLSLIHLSWYWLRRVDGRLKIQGTYIKDWSIQTKNVDVYPEARSYIRNAIEYMEEKSRERIEGDLEKVTQKIQSGQIITPPSTKRTASSSSGRKRKSRGRSQTSSSGRALTQRSSAV